MPAVIQIKRRTGIAGAPASLAVGELAYNDPGGAAIDALYIGTSPAAVKTLISPTRQVEIAGAQTITGVKTIAVTNLKITGGATTNILTTDGAGNLAWSAAPAGGIISVAHDGTLAGDGNLTPLSVVRLPMREITLQAIGGTVITVTPASFDGSGAATMTDFEITQLDAGTY
jgi:hypothetical protein